MKRLAIALLIAVCAAAPALAEQKTAELDTGDTFSLKFDPPVHEISATVIRLGKEMAGGKLSFFPQNAPIMKKRIFIRDKPVTEERSIRRCGFEKFEFKLDKGRAKIEVNY